MQENTYKSSLNSKNIRNLIMNKKNILYASIAVFLIVGIAVTMPKGSKNHKDTSKGIHSIETDKELAAKKAAQELVSKKAAQELEDKKVAQELEAKTVEINNVSLNSAQEIKKNDAAEYTEGQLNRAKTYQAKSWAKDDTINDAAWKAAQLIDIPSEESAEDSKNPTEEKSKTASTLNTANTQDSKNSAMID